MMKIRNVSMHQRDPGDEAYIWHNDVVHSLPKTIIPVLNFAYKLLFHVSEACVWTYL